MSISKQEKKVVQELFKWFSTNPVIIDVGANKGLWSDIILEKFYENCKIYCIEPNNILSNYLRVKYDYNDNVFFCSKAAYKKSFGSVPFYFFADRHNGLSSIYHNPEWDYLKPETTEVDSVTVDYLFTVYGLGSVDCIKIDVEGADYDVLQGCEKLLQDKRVKFIQIEYSPHYKLNNYKFKDVIEFAEKFGYSVYDYDGEYFQKINKENFIEDYTLTNYIITYINIGRFHYTQLWNQEFIKNTAALERVSFALEIGIFEGLTSNYICDNLLKENGRLVCVDPLKDYYLEPNDIDYFKGQYQRFIQNTSGQPIELIRKKSDDAFDEELRNYMFDFIYVDGNHTYEAVLKDGGNAIYHLNVGGYLLFDDYEWSEETKKAIDEFIDKYAASITVKLKDYQVLIFKHSNI